MTKFTEIDLEKKRERERERERPSSIELDSLSGGFMLASHTFARLANNCVKIIKQYAPSMHNQLNRKYVRNRLSSAMTICRLGFSCLALRSEHNCYKSKSASVLLVTGTP